MLCCVMSSRVGQSIEQPRIPCPQLLLGRLREMSSKQIERLYPVPVGRRMQHYRPVTPVGHTIFAKRLQHMADIGRQIMGCPLLVVRLRHQPANLAEHLRKGGKLSNVVAPGIEAVSSDVRLCNMVEHKAGAGTAPNKL